jgi:hypothetical protein
VSVPIAQGAKPAATATAEPLLEPPGTNGSSPDHGFSGVPMLSLTPQLPNAYSSVCTLPNTMAPASCSKRTTVAVLVTGVSGNVNEPARVGRPATSMRSFTAMGTPSTHALYLVASAT